MIIFFYNKTKIMETLIVKAQGEKLRALKAFLSALNMQFQKEDASLDGS